MSKDIRATYCAHCEECETTLTFDTLDEAEEYLKIMHNHPVEPDKYILTLDPDERRILRIALAKYAVAVKSGPIAQECIAMLERLSRL